MENLVEKEEGKRKKGRRRVLMSKLCCSDISTLKLIT